MRRTPFVIRPHRPLSTTQHSSPTWGDSGGSDSNDKPNCILISDDKSEDTKSKTNNTKHPTGNNTNIGEGSDESDTYINEKESNEMSKERKTGNTTANQIPCLHELYSCSEDGKHSTLTPNLKAHTDSHHIRKNPDIGSDNTDNSRMGSGNKMQNVHSPDEKDIENADDTNNLSTSNSSKPKKDNDNYYQYKRH